MKYLTYKYKMYSLCDRNMYIHRDMDSFAEVYNHFIALHKRYYRRFGKYPSKFTMINHLGFSDFLNILKYVAKKTGKVVKQIDKWLPTSKTCSACDTVKENLELRQRTFHCCECGLEIDRDLNAAINIHRWGRPPMAEVA